MEAYIFIGSIVAIILLSLSQIIYIKDILKGLIRPHLLSWTGWSLLMLASFVSQGLEEGWEWSMIGLGLSSLGCVVIALSAFLTRNFEVKRSDFKFVAAGLGCFVLYLMFKDPWLTTIFAIAADFVLGWPTIVKAKRFPESEASIGWFFSVGSWSITLAISLFESPLFSLFPTYLLLWSCTMVYLTRTRV